MNPSYEKSTFKIHLPSYLEFDDHVQISFKFEYKKGQTDKIIYSKAILSDRFGVEHSDEGHEHYFDVTKKMAQSMNISIHQDKKRIWMKNSRLQLMFLSETGEITNVVFAFESDSKGKLLDVNYDTMRKEDEEVFIKAVSDRLSSVKQKSLDVDGNKFSEDAKNIDNDNIHVEDIPEMDIYLKALNAEKLYLMHEGGRKYKVTNGKMVSKAKGIFSYIFDLETELHISDDAPIDISTGLFRASGTVLMCEDFQIIVQLKSNIGERIGNALIRVEPWKLLEALQEKLRAGISLGKNKMASRIMKDGPKLATKESGKQIPKGHDAVIEKAMSESVCVVWGPPGTGKTHMMAELAINSMNAGKTVLIVSHSNVSVDGVAKKIDELLRKSNQTAALKAGKILRYGYVRDEELNKNPYVNSFYYTVTKNPALNEKLDKLQAEYDKLKHTKGLDNPRVIEIREDIGKIRSAIREQEQHYVSEASVVATTISKIVIDGIFDNKKYDVVMFDEVSMAYVLQVVCAATFAREHFICVGDFMQLAPIAQSEKKDILCQDIFAYLGINRSGHVYYHPWLVMLNEQRRMHPQISGFSNQYVYGGMLLNHPDTRTNRNEIVNAELFSKQAINLIDLSGCYCAASKNADNSRFNILSAMISFAIAVKTEKNVETVSIITPYAAQTRLVRAMELDYREHNDTQIRCATVHQFQGSESDVVIFDAVESYPSRKPGWLIGKDFNSIKRLINVAVTRAKGKLVTVANSKFWSNNYENTTHLFYRLISYLKDKGNTVRHEKDRTLEALVDELSLKGGPTFYLNANVYMDIFLKDIRNARGKIVISLPCGKLNPEYESVICQLLVEKKQQGIQVLIKCNDYADLPDAWKKYTWGTSNAVFPLVMIDEKITWYGVPDASWKFKDGADEYHTVCPIVCRLDGKHTAELIRSLSDLEYRETDKGKKQLLSRPETPTDDPNGAGGLSEYVSQNIKCPDCKKPLRMTKGKSGKTILWCKECKKTHLLAPDDINHYMLVKHVKCPIHKCDMMAKVGKYGLYIKCDAGHNMKPEEI